MANILWVGGLIHSDDSAQQWEENFRLILAGEDHWRNGLVAEDVAEKRIRKYAVELCAIRPALWAAVVNRKLSAQARRLTLFLQDFYSNKSPACGGMRCTLAYPN